jgi:protein involved in polysaccharide export with SLBB domain
LIIGWILESNKEIAGFCSTNNAKSINIRKMVFRFLLLFFITFLSLEANSQNITEAAARAELQKRGYDETRFREELTKKGVNIDAVDVNNPVEMARVKKAVEEVMVILDAEKRAASKTAGPNQTSKSTDASVPQSKIDDTRSVDDKAKVVNQSKDIQKAVKDGATIEEAVSEKLQEQANEKLPPARTYGQHIFRDKSLQLFRTAEDAKPSKTYILGPGDKVSISIWGPSQTNYALEIEKEGYIQPTNQPRYYIAGLTIAQAEQLLYGRLRNYHYFQKENFEMAVTTARTINVNIVGEVFNNGTFNVSAINTAFNALIAAGGPNDIGSVRKIQVLGPGKKPKTLDVYKYLQNPTVSQDFYLSENDYINVPVADRLISISGAINRPFQYELIEKENLKELVKLAGGLKANALKGNIQVKRIENDSVRIIDIDYLSLERTGKDFTLLNGDIVTIPEINTNIVNEVSISGAVENPGTYAMTNNEKISDILKKAVLLNNAITDIAYLKRYNSDFKTIRYEFININEILANPQSNKNLILQRGDELIISSKASFTENYEINIEGSVRTPTTMALDVENNIKVSDAIFFAGGLSYDAITEFAYIFRTRTDESKTQEYISVDLKEALANPTSAANISLQPKDRLVIYSKNSFTDESFVKVAGAVRLPGDFLYNPSLTLRGAILLAGGHKREAALDRVDVYRLEFEENRATRVLVATLKLDETYNVRGGGINFELQPFDQIFIRQAPEFELQRNVLVNGEVKYPGTYALMSDNTKLATIIREAGGVTDEAFLKGATLLRVKENLGYIIIDLELAIKEPKSFENIILQEGDEISIPKMSNIVSISGATRISELYINDIANKNKIQVPYRKGKNAGYYINEYAGGLSKEGSINKISVIDASGKVTKAKNFLFFKKYPKVGPGSEIKVGYKEVKVKENIEGKESDVKWGEVLANSIAQATAILSIILLVQNVN